MKKNRNVIWMTKKDWEQLGKDKVLEGDEIKLLIVD
jgi:hypothetical protein